MNQPLSLPRHILGILRLCTYVSVIQESYPASTPTVDLSLRRFLSLWCMRCLYVNYMFDQSRQFSRPWKQFKFKVQARDKINLLQKPGYTRQVASGSKAHSQGLWQRLVVYRCMMNGILTPILFLHHIQCSPGHECHHPTQIGPRTKAYLPTFTALGRW